MKAEKIIRMCNGKPRYVYPHDQIEKIVKEVESSEKGINEVLDQYRICHATLKRWIKAYGQSNTLPTTCKCLSDIQKRQILNEVDTGKLTVAEAVKRYKINETSLYNWRKRYSADIACQTIPDNMEKQANTSSYKKEGRQIEDLKLKIAALETMIDMAEKEFHIPIRKKCGSRQ
jgi:transposase